jgi:hypothetical protein
MFIHQILVFHMLSPGTADFHGKEPCLFTLRSTAVENKVLREMFETMKNIYRRRGEMIQRGAEFVPVNKVTFILRVKRSSIRPASREFAWEK